MLADGLKPQSTHPIKSLSLILSCYYRADVFHSAHFLWSFWFWFGVGCQRVRVWRQDWQRSAARHRFGLELGTVAPASYHHCRLLLKMTPHLKMAALRSRLFQLRFCTAGGSDESRPSLFNHRLTPKSVTDPQTVALFLNICPERHIHGTDTCGDKNCWCSVVRGCVNQPIK